MSFVNLLFNVNVFVQITLYVRVRHWAVYHSFIISDDLHNNYMSSASKLAPFTDRGSETASDPIVNTCLEKTSNQTHASASSKTYGDIGSD